MRLTHDPENNVAYLYLGEEKRNSVALTRPCGDGTIIFDYDRDGMLVGIEILDAKGTLTTRLLASAERE